MGITINAKQIGTAFVAENMTFGGPVNSTFDLQRQVADLRTLLDKAQELPEETRAPVAEALKEAAEVTPDKPEAKTRIVDKLQGALSILTTATGIVTQTTPLVNAIQAVIRAAGLVV